MCIRFPPTQMHALIADRVYVDLNAQVPAMNPASEENGSNATCFIETLCGNDCF